MIRIEIDNESIWLENKTKLRLELNSTLFQTDVIPGSVVYPFNIPVKGNESIFNHAHFVEINKLVKSFDANLFIGDSIRFSCKLLLKKISPKYYRSSIILNTFSTDFKDLNLTNLVYDDITIGGTPHSATNVAFHAEQIVKGNLAADYTFPVIFAEFFYGELDDDTNEAEFNPDWGEDDGSGTKVGKYINNFVASAGTFPYNPVNENPECDNIHTMVPMPYVMPVLENIFSSENYLAFGDFFDNAELQKLILFNNYPLDQKYKQYFVRASQIGSQSFTGEAVIQFNDDSSGDNEDDDSAFNTSTYKYEIKARGYHQVKINLDYTNNSIEALHRVTWSLLKDTTVIDSGVISGPYVLSGELEINFTEFEDTGDIGSEYSLKVFFEDDDGLGWDSCNGTVEYGLIVVSNNSVSDLNQFANTLNITNHLPDIEAGGFLNAIRLAFGLSIFYDFEGKEIQFDFSKDVVTSPNYLDLTSQVIANIIELGFSDFTGFTFNIDYHNDVVLYDNYEYLGAFDTNADLPTPSGVNKVALVLSTNVINIYRKDHDTEEMGWLFFSDNFYDLVKEDGSEEINPGLSAQAMHRGNDLLTAETKGTGSSPAFETGVNEFDFILMFDRGMQEDDNGDDYPMASSVNLDLAGNSLGNYSLVMDGDAGLYEQFLKPWYEFILNAEEVRRMFVCNETQMMEIIKLFSPQRGKKTRKCRIDNINYIPKKFSFIITMEGIEQVEGILMKKGGETL